MLGVYLSGHPLDEYAKLMEKYANVKSSDLTSAGVEFSSENDEDSMIINTSRFDDGDRVVMAGMVSSVRTMITKKSQEMARMTLEDFDGVIDVIVFPKVFERRRNLIQNDMIVAVSGRVSFKDENDAEILAEDVVPIDNISNLASDYARDSGHGIYPDRKAPQDPVKLRITEDVVERHGDSKAVLMHLTDMFSMYPGNRDVLVYLPGQKAMRCNQDSRITFTEDLKTRLVRMLGAENVKD
ncbi:MAG: hypothetical protein J6D07_01350, partial [Mogibacterium sp.]|nr:hypothetical protein [Mogibacterium sp.]